MTNGKTQSKGNGLEALATFLAGSPTPFHATENLARRLEAAGFRPLAETERWKCAPGDKRYVIRGGSSIVAFVAGADGPESGGFRIAGAHTDSPCLKAKPNADATTAGYCKVGVEPYGGMLLSTWFDRDLSLAGKVVYRTSKGVRAKLVDFRRPVAVVPNLAIHLQRDVNEGRAIHRQNELPPIWAQGLDGRGVAFDAVLLAQLRQEGATDAEAILAHELCFYDTQAPSVVGLGGEFLASARLDNLLSCWAATEALVASTGDRWRVVVCNDHEEVGSVSRAGAAGTLLRDVLKRLSGDDEALLRAIAGSLLVSCDNAHGIHPNYPEKHEPRHAPLLNGGPALKVNLNQRYATEAETAAAMEVFAAEADVPLQRFVARSDMGCGSTIGPITAAELGLRTVDLGVPTFAMHSIRELAGTKDAPLLVRLLATFFSRPTLPLP
jgi:aspartyl aminopeptidase